jgi:hypothetical protein
MLNCGHCPHGSTPAHTSRLFSERSRSQLIEVGCGKLPGDDADLRRISKLRKELRAVFPGEAEYSYARHGDSGHEVSNGWKMRWGEFLHPLMPIHVVASA